MEPTPQVRHRAQHFTSPGHCRGSCTFACRFTAQSESCRTSELEVAWGRNASARTRHRLNQNAANLPSLELLPCVTFPFLKSPPYTSEGESRARRTARRQACRSCRYTGYHRVTRVQQAETGQPGHGANRAARTWGKQGITDSSPNLHRSELAQESSALVATSTTHAFISSSTTQC